MYKNVKILNAKEHSFYRYLAPDNLFYAKEMTYVPITFSEVKLLCCDFPVVVIYEKDGHSTLAILTGDVSNQAINKEGKWEGAYVPAFIGRYPFVLVEDETEEHKLSLGFDMESGCFSSPEGVALFDEVGTPDAVISERLKYLESLYKEMQITNAIIHKFAELEILEESQYSISYEDKDARTVGGFWVVNKEKLLALPDEALAEAMKSGWTELIELHLLSLKNIAKLR